MGNSGQEVHSKWSHVKDVAGGVHSRNPMSVAVRVRKKFRDIDPSVPVLKIDTVEEQMNDLLAQERLVAELSAFFGVSVS
jgi:hypothetical protein